MKNQVVWFEVPVVDLERATRFYTEVLAAELEKMPGAESVALFPGAGEPGVSGCLTSHGTVKPSEHGMLLYFNAEGRLDEAERAVVPAGGQIIEAKHAIGPWGYRVLALDSEGNRIALHST